MKKSLIFALALMLVLAFASSAFAAQTFETRDGYNFYQPTVKSFTYDSKTNYPYEIYLPNEDPGQYRIHSSYTKNTDACASCHATHTAVGNYLLQWYTAYETCMACHDGTISSTYDVVNGVVGSINGGDRNGAPTPGGAFGLGNEGSNSMHNVTGAVTITSAPGGSVVGEDRNTNPSGSSKVTQWTPEFGCESCHSPHGNGGNARILAPDPNGAASALAAQNNWLITGIQATISGTTLAGEKAFDGTDIAGKVYYAASPITTVDTQVYNVGAGYIFLKPGRESYFAVNGFSLYQTVYASDWVIDNSKGFTRAIYKGSEYASTFTTAYKANVKFQAIPVLKVVMDIDNYLNTGNVAEKVTHVSGLNNFCGACHTDYNTASFEVYYGVKADGTVANKLGSAYQFLTGSYSKAHRHTVGTDRSITPTTDALDYEFKGGLADYNKRLLASGAKKGAFTCLTCHVAHGVNQDYWQRTLIGADAANPKVPGWTTAMVSEGELAGSSVLKRMPNMGTCETCHAKGTANEGYAANANGGVAVAVNNDPTIDNLINQFNATYVGSNNSMAPCGQCHREATEAFINTQHGYLVSPWDPDQYFTVFSEDGKGNATQEAVYSLNALASPATLAYLQANAANQFIPADKAAVNAALTDTHNLLSAGQVPIGKKDTAVREIILRTFDGTNYRYTVIASYSYANGVWSFGSWEDSVADHFKISAVNSGYVSCFGCHGVGKVDNGGIWAPARQILDSWFTYFDGTSTTKPAIDLAVSCETCHGEASNHVKQPMSTNIFNPTTAEMKDQSRICGRCHTGGGNANGFTGAYSPWKLSDTRPQTLSAFGTTYANNSVLLDAYFEIGYDMVITGNPLPAKNFATTSNWTYKGVGKESSRRWDAPNHSQYSQFTVSKHFVGSTWNGYTAQLSCATCHDAHSEELSVNQLKITEKIICQTCHGNDITPYKYMPLVNGKTVRYHDFGEVINPDTQKFYNVNLTAQPTYE